MTRQELIRRYILSVAGLLITAAGIACAKHGELGVSPLSSSANVMSYKFTSISLGTWLIILNCVLIAGQILILRKNFQPIQLLQLPLSFPFGWFTDFTLWCLSPIPTDHYLVRLALVVVGFIILAFGATLSVTANVVMSSGEAFVKAVSDTLHKSFGSVKVVFDVSCVTIAVIMSLAFFDFTIVGVREGTIITALGTGTAVKWFTKRLRDPLEKYCHPSPSKPQ